MDAWILLSIVAGTVAAYYYFFKDLNYFKKHGIIHTPSWPVLGNMGPIFFRQQSMAEVVLKTYNESEDAKYVGFFDNMNPVMMIRDPELIRSIGIKNFESFTDHQGFIDEANDPLFGKNLFSLRGEKWRNMRNVLTPAFTSSKLKNMFTLISECAVSFTDFLAGLPPDKNIMEVKNCFARYTNDVIATCVFGVKVDSMRNPDNEFYVYGKEATTFDLASIIRSRLIRALPRISKVLGVRFVSEHIRMFFKDLIRSIMQIRDTQGIVRPDMLQQMMETRGKRGPGKELSIEEITSLAFGLFSGGFDTVSTLMCFAAHEIAVNPDIQARLRDEVDDVLKSTNGTLTYEALREMQYLDAVIGETLRMWPAVVFVDRVCTQDFELPPALPGGKPFVVKKGRSIWIPIYGLHRDPKYFEKPDEFNPERFLGENKKAIDPITYIPFGLGPRMCIGHRFALLGTKLMLFHLLARCELKPCEKTSHPLRLSTHFTIQPENGFWLKIQPRSNTHFTSNGVATCHIQEYKSTL